MNYYAENPKITLRVSFGDAMAILPGAVERTEEPVVIADEAEVTAVSERFIERNKEAYEELAKG